MNGRQQSMCVWRKNGDEEDEGVASRRSIGNGKRIGLKVYALPGESLSLHLLIIQES